MNPVSVHVVVAMPMTRVFTVRLAILVLSLPVFVMFAWGLYRVSPVSVYPSLILLPFVLVFALSVRITAGTFKKYL